MSKPIERVTLFKIPREEDRDKVLEQYKVMKRTALKDGKPYMLQCESGHTADEARAQGWTLATKTKFATKEDMDYYDQQCEAHQALKEVVTPVREDVMTVWFYSAL